MDASTLQTISSLLGPIGAAVALALFLSLRSKVNPDTYLKSVVERLTAVEEENADLRRRMTALQEQLTALQIENAELLAKISLLESAHQSLPLPMWLKDEHGRVLTINSAYEETFLVPRGYKRSDYVGHYDADVWPDHIAAQFTVNDRHVFRDGVTWIGTEKVTNADGEDENWRIIKYPRFAGNVKVGIGGVAIPDSRDDVNVEVVVPELQNGA